VNREPDFDALVEGASPEEGERLRRVHDLLVAAGPPPELPPALAEAPAERRERAPILTTLPRRRLGATATAAIGLAAAAFGIGYFAGAGNNGTQSTEFQSVFVVPMKATSNARPGAVAALRLGKKQEGGNIPMLLAASGLDPVPEGGYYELWLTKKVGKRQIKEVSCGTFIASDRDISVRMNAPYTLEPGFTGWIITKHLPGAKTEPTLFTT
jgi:hypothetical protein